ncbi:MAG: hypothetical protein H6755_07925 [Candidatus Omnitrophica bacterium]|nr:hypothetical protein [Candidatus Saccharibacteria bacterium]MCA9407564.1 hypothetical protein [Candidatus Omnitrophota bacterium]MCB9748320.1 hypothetical protein [Candidatus Omnitrophota bacterium]
MVAGLPGTGLGGIFYLLSALIMPLGELVMLCLGKSNKKRWKCVFGQFSLAIGILGGFFVTGWIIALLIKKIGGTYAQNAANNIIEVKTFAISTTTLLCVVFAIEILHLLFRKTRPTV